jgi:hypothetical protein
MAKKFIRINVGQRPSLVSGQGSGQLIIFIATKKYSQLSSTTLPFAAEAFSRRCDPPMPPSCAIRSIFHRLPGLFPSILHSARGNEKLKVRKIFLWFQKFIFGQAIFMAVTKSISLTSPLAIA